MFIVHPSRSIHGSALVPSSKSHTLRAILWASLAKGSSEIHHYLHSPDTEVFLQASQQLGCHIQRHPSMLIIEGAPRPQFPKHSTLYAGSSGIAFRFLTALSAVFSEQITILGDSQLQRRPILPLLQALSTLGADIHIPTPNHIPPFLISGPLSSGFTEIDGSDSQYASALMVACCLTPEPTSFHILNPKEQPWLRLSTWWLTQLGIEFSQPQQNIYAFPGNQRPACFSYHVAGDFSSAAFLAAAAILSTSPHPTRLDNVNMNDIQGDKEFFTLLQQLGGHIEFENNSIVIYPSPLQGGNIDMDLYIDALPILSVLCCFAQTPSRLYNAAGAKDKECDRITAITKELQAMGADIHMDDDGVTIRPSPLRGAELSSHHDHRIAMALTIGALHASGPSVIHDTNCVRKTFPNFVKTLQSLNCHIQECT